MSQSGRRAEQQHGQEQDRRPQEEQHGARHVGQPARRVVGQRRERVDEVGRVVEPRVLFHVLRWGAGAAARRAAGGHGSWTTAAGSPFLYLAVPRGWARAPITVPVQYRTTVVYCTVQYGIKHAVIQYSTVPQYPGGDGGFLLLCTVL